MILVWLYVVTMVSYLAAVFSRAIPLSYGWALVVEVFILLAFIGVEVYAENRLKDG